MIGQRIGVVAFVMCAHVSVAAAQKLVITAPDVAEGDGTTSIAVRVAIEPTTAIETAKDLALTTDAGTVGDASPDGDAAVVYQLIAPRVASQTKVTLRATISVGRKTVHAKRTLVVEPPKFEQTEAGSGGPFDVRAPDRMLLGVHGAADISIAAPEGAPPRLLVNVGAVTELTAGDDGRLHATYTPPSARFPQVAIVAVVATDSAAIDWLTISLHGKASVALHSEAHASVVVRVGATDYGPVHTDRKGEASVAVTVAPGVGKANTIATDSLGNKKRGSLALGAPPFDRLLAICPVVDSRFRVLLLDTDGAPAKRGTIDLQATAGSFEPADNEGPGVFVATYTAPDGATVGDGVTLTASIDAGLHKDECDAVMPGEVPSRVDITLARPTFAPGDEPIAVTVALVYPGRLPALDVDATLRASLGDISELVPGEGHVLTAMWTLPDQFDGQRRAELVATVESSSASGSAQVDLVAGPAARVVAELGATELLADGASTTTVVARVFDAYDNLVVGAALLASAGGLVGAFDLRDDGSQIATYTAVRSFSAREDTVRLSAGSASVEARIDLVPLPRRYTARVRFGYLTNFAKVSGPMVAVGAETRLPVLYEYLAVGVEVSFYRSRTSQMDAAGAQEVTTIVDGIPLLATARLSWPLGRATLYAVGRAGIAVIDAGAETTTTGRVVRSDTAFAVSGGLGADFAVGPGSAGIELAMMRAAVESGQITGNAGGLQIGAGYRVGF